MSKLRTHQGESPINGFENRKEYDQSELKGIVKRQEAFRKTYRDSVDLLQFFRDLRSDHIAKLSKMRSVKDEFDAPVEVYVVPSIRKEDLDTLEEMITTLSWNLILNMSDISKDSESPYAIELRRVLGRILYYWQSLMDYDYRFKAKINGYRFNSKTLNYLQERIEVVEDNLEEIPFDTLGDLEPRQVETTYFDGEEHIDAWKVEF
jgi:hypothetical protein